VSKVVVIGIDALDAVLLERWKQDLPNFRKMMERGHYAPLESTTPPDSIPAWVTIYTGMQPWEHGLLDTMDYLDIKAGGPALDIQMLVGRTFWDRASRQGKRVCVINPLLAYPVWPVNGIMVNGPVFISGEAQAHPPDILERFKIPELGGMTDFPGRKDLAAFLERTEQVTRDLARFGLELFALEEWDVFFICFLTLDRVMHFAWRYTDPSDPTYPGKNAIEDSIRRFFVVFDSVVGEFMARLSERQALLVVSDHGHGMRPPRVLCVNEILRREGLLKTKRGRIPGVNTVALVEKAKGTFLRTMQRLDLEDMVYRIAALIPKDRRRSLKTSAYAVTRAGSTAWVSDIGGGTSFSGIEIDAGAVEKGSAAYEALRTRLIALLGAVKDSRGKPLVRWAKRREEAFVGANARKYPDVVFELVDGYGVDRTLFCGTTGIATTHKKVSGGHNQFGALLLYNSTVPHLEEQVHITSVYGLIGKILGLT
jgi:predicted AlkP superfamily phosphohydrolase/phosphomutase